MLNYVAMDTSKQSLSSQDLPMDAASGRVVILYIESDGQQWAQFIQNKLSENQYDIKTQVYEVNESFTVNQENEICVILFTPNFLQETTHNSILSSDSESSLVVLLGTTEEEFKSAVYPKQEVVPQWNFFLPSATESSVRELLLAIVQQYESFFDDVIIDNSSSDQSSYDLVPQDSIEEDDEEEIGYSTLPEPRQVNCIYKATSLPTSNDASESTSILLLMDRPVEGELIILMEDSDIPIYAEHLDKAAYKFPVKNEGPHRFKVCSEKQTFGTAEVQFTPTKKGEDDVFYNTAKLDTLRELLQDELDPISLLCKALNVQDPSRDNLDAALVQRCSKLRSFQSLSGTTLKGDGRKDYTTKSDQECPTLLHFCAEFNLPKFAEELLQNPLMTMECLKVNRSGDTPTDVAVDNGHTEVQTILAKYEGKESDYGRDNGKSNPDPSKRDAQTLQHNKKPKSTAIARSSSCPKPARGNIDSGFVSSWSDRGSVLTNCSDESFSGDLTFAALKPKTEHQDTESIHAFPAKSTSPHLDVYAPRTSGKYENEDTSGRFDLPSFAEGIQPPKKTQTLPHNMKPIPTLSRSQSASAFATSKSTFFIPAQEEMRRNSDPASNDGNYEMQTVNRFEGKRKSKGIKNALSKMFHRNNRKTSITEPSILEERQDDVDDKHTQQGFPCSNVSVTETALTKDDITRKGQEKEKHKKQNKPKNKFRVDRRKSIRERRILEDANMQIIDIPCKH